jgi:hypothetical protein
MDEALEPGPANVSAKSHLAERNHYQTESESGFNILCSPMPLKEWGLP